MKQLLSYLLNSKYNLLLKNTQEMVIFFDSDGKITECNSNVIHELGYGEEIFKVPVYDIFKNALSFIDNQMIISELFQSDFHETVAYRKNQTCFPVNLRVRIVKKRTLCFGICTAVNITDRKEAAIEISNLKSELDNYNQMGSELVAKITHELRTPVNGIMGFANNLLETELNTSQTEAVHIIKKCCDNMNIIINHLLDYAKLANNKLELEETEFSFYGFIRNILDFNMVSINEKGLKLILDISNDIPDRLIGDELRLSQVLNNLLSNAIKFTPSGQIGLEVMKLSQTNNCIELFFMVMDTGIGISREEKDKLFKSFSQVDSSITRRFGGTGLGLSISKILVEAMHGTIEVDSEKNKGSTFSFSARLGIAKASKAASTISDIMDYQDLLNLDQEILSRDKSENNNLSDIDYITMRLQEANSEINMNVDKQELMRKTIILINELLEKLTITIEMENWERAEELAYRLKNLIPADHTVNTKNFLRLLLAVRKENHDASMKILNEIKVFMCKEK